MSSAQLHNQKAQGLAPCESLQSVIMRKHFIILGFFAFFIFRAWQSCITT